MPKTNTVSSSDEMNEFRRAVKGIKPLKQDKVVTAKVKTRIAVIKDQQKLKKTHASFEFSDTFEGFIQPEGALRYCRESTPSYALKQLRRGDYNPEYVLDLHGMTRTEAKQELSALLYAAKEEHIDCVCIIHGHGKGILKQALPNYLIQHPQVLAFHQAPLEYGGQGALLVLLATDSHFTGKLL